MGGRSRVRIATPHREGTEASAGNVEAAPPSSVSNGGDGEERGPVRPAKRKRIAIACTTCRYRKSRCDGCRPKCSTCRDHGYDCIYPPAGQLNQNTTASRLHLSSVEERLASVEQLLHGLNGRVHQLEQGDTNTRDSPRQSTSEEGEETYVTYDNEEPQDPLDYDPTDGIGSMVFSAEEDTGYFGPSSNIALTRHIVRATTSVLRRTQTQSGPISPDAFVSHNHLWHVSRPLSPVHETSTTTKKKPALTSIYSLPPAEETLRLIDEYFSNTGLLFPYIHRETFIEAYRELVSNNRCQVKRAWLGLLNMVLAMATSVNYSSTVSAQIRKAKSDVFFSQAMALCGKLIRTRSSLEIVQFLLLMSQYLQGTERSTQTWAVHGLAVKAAYQLGLHSSDVTSQYPPLEREIRTRIWYGCVILDRSLSMTLGRPASIPDNYVRLDMPRPFPGIGLDVSSLAPANEHPEEQSLAFYNATITLYKIMWTIIDNLYGGNLGCSSQENLFETASQLLRVEQEIMQWQTSLGISQFRVILTLRYLNVCVLAHRPFLQKFLEALGDQDHHTVQLSTLRQVGSNSLRTCIQSATAIVDLVSYISRVGQAQQHLGAWWFSLYYIFNAALVLYSGLLIRHDAETRNMPIPEGTVGVRRSQLQQAIECLLLLDRGNPMTDKCAKYTSTLARILDSLYYDNTAHPAETHPSERDETSDVGAVGRTLDVDAAELLHIFSQSQTPLGAMDVSEFMDPADLEFLNIPLIGHGGLQNGDWPQSSTM